jgi:SAM-dependent methyltransferase
MKNRILTDTDRIKFRGLIEDMFDKVPDMMKRKIDRANVQQAFAVDFIYPKYAKKKNILCVGSYEDTAYEYLKVKGLKMIAIDPAINMDLHTFVGKVDEKFDLIFSVSVIEHVENDEEFIKDICNLLDKDGIAVLTMDFNDTYSTRHRHTSHKPAEDYRLYTLNDYKRLGKIIEDNGCMYVDEFVANSPPDFTYGDSKYSFSTMVFKKIK